MHQALDVLHRASALCAKQAKEWEALKAEFEKAGNEESSKPKSKATSPKPKPKPAVVKESDSDDDSDDVPPAKPKAKAAAAAPKPAADDSDSDDDSDVPPPKPKAAAKPKPQAAQDSDDSDDDSDVPSAKPKPQAKAAAKPKAPAVADSDDSDDSDDDVPAAKPKPAAKAAAKPADDDDSDEDSDAPAPKPKAAPKRKAAENGAEPAAKVQKLETTELMMLNIPESMTDDDIWNHYKSLGDEAITRINRPASNQTMCFVTFQSAELAAKGLAMDPPEKDGTWVTVKPAVPKGKGKGKGGKGDGEVFDVMIRNCADGITDDVVTKHYKKIADSIQHIRWVTDRETGAFRGFGFIKFTSKEAADTAVEMGGPVYEEQETTVAHAAGKGEKGGKGKGGKGDKGGKGGKGKGKGGRGPSMKPEGEKVTFDD